MYNSGAKTTGSKPAEAANPSSPKVADAASRILIVDDEQYIREILSRWLNTEGYDCITAGSAEEAWELLQEGIPATLITDSMAGHFMSRGKVDIVLVGADRIAANGDVANKIGTYSLAILARENGLPFYSVAPTSTVDLSIAAGADIPIEERDPSEVTHLYGVPIAAEGVEAAHPAFDVTPHRYVTGIVTEEGIVYPPFGLGLKKAKQG